MHFVIKGGWSLLPDYDIFLSEVEAQIPKGHFIGKFDVAILQLGGNNMDGNRCPLLYASKMEDFASLLRSDYEIQYIYVCEIFTRPRYHVTFELNILPIVSQATNGL